MRVIGLSGKIGSGKSTLAGLLKEMLPNAERAAFADAVKHEASVIYGFDLELAFSESGKVRQFLLSDAGQVLMGRKAATIREVLQYHGTQLRRAQDPHYWTKQLRWELAEAAHAGDIDVVIVDDVRFPDEADLIRNFPGGELYRLQPYPGWSPGPFAGHISETALDDYNRFHLTLSPQLGQDALRLAAKAIAEYGPHVAMEQEVAGF